MKLSKIKKLCAVALAVSLAASVFVGCGSNGETGGQREQKLTYNLGGVVETIDPALNTAVDGSTVISNAFEGLVRLDENEKAIPGVAKEWKVSDDGLTYTFTLRDDAKWSDGIKKLLQNMYINSGILKMQKNIIMEKLMKKI